MLRTVLLCTKHALGLGYYYFGVHVCVCVCAALFKMTSHFILKAISLILEEKRLVLQEDEEGNSQPTLHQHNRNLKTAIG